MTDSPAPPPSARKSVSDRRFLVALWATLSALALVHGWSLMRLPTPFVDEAWSASRAWSLVTTGRPFSSLDAGVFDRFEGYWTFFPWLPVLIQSLPYRFMEAPTLAPLRLVSLLFGLLLLVAVYAVGRPFLGRWGSLGSLGLVGLSIPFLGASHLARYDIFAAALGWLALALIFHPSLIPTVRASFGAGLLLGLGYEMHAHAAIFGPPLLALYLWHFRAAFWRQRAFWAWVTGGSVGLAFYIALHVLPFPATYLAINRLAFTRTHTPPLLTGDPATIATAFTDMAAALHTASALFGSTPFLVWLVLFVIGGGVVLWLHRPQDRPLVLLSLALMLSHTLLIRNKAPYYMILSSPTLSLMLTLLIQRIAQRFPARAPQRALRVAVLSYLITVGFVTGVFVLRSDDYRQYLEIQHRINQIVLPTDKILAAQTYWFGLYENEYRSWEGIVYYQRYESSATVEDALVIFSPNIIILDDHMRAFIRDDPGPVLYTRFLRIPKDEFDAFLETRAQRVDSFHSSLYGHIEIFRVDQ